MKTEGVYSFVCLKLGKVVYYMTHIHWVVYYESRKRELTTRPIYECRCDERLKTKVEKSIRLTYNGLLGELEQVLFIMNQ